ncbi:MAG: MraY family glycosyltransferase, partial [Planctomycetota bacterium]
MSRTEPVQTWVQVLQDRWWIGVVSLLVCLVVTPIVRHIAGRARPAAGDREFYGPRGRRIPFLGGLVICIGLLAGLGAFLATTPSFLAQWPELVTSLVGGSLGKLLKNPVWNLIAITVAFVAITVIGLLSDLTKIGRKRQIAGQMLCAAILLAGGVGIRMGYLVMRPLGLSQFNWVLLPISTVMCIAVVVAMSNATKVLGALDGLCSGVTGIVTIGFLALTTWLAMWSRFPGTDELRVGLCLATAGAALGFLPYNIPPASVFLGNAGGMLLGFFVATMMAMFCQEGHARWLIASFVVFAVPILDTAIAVVRRMAARRSIFADDRSHLHHQLLDRGLTLKQVVTLF